MRLIVLISLESRRLDDQGEDLDPTEFVIILIGSVILCVATFIAMLQVMHKPEIITNAFNVTLQIFNLEIP